MNKTVHFFLLNMIVLIIGFLIYGIYIESKKIHLLETTDYYVCDKIISYSENGNEIYLSFNGFERFDFNEVKQVQGFRIEKIINSTEIVAYVKPPFNQKLKLAELFYYFEKQYCVD